MFRKLTQVFTWSLVWAALAPGIAQAQGRGGGTWSTTANDAQRTSAQRGDARISKDSLSKPGFQFLWKRKLENQPKGPNGLTQPVFSAPGFITYKGFKGLAYVGGASDNVFAVDYDLNRMFFTTHLSTAAAATPTAACPGGLTSITMTAQLGAAGGGRGGGAGGGRGAAAPGAPGVAPAVAAPQGAPPPGAPAGAAPGAPGVAPAAPVPARGGGGGGGRGGNGVYVVSSGGMVHSLNAQTGMDLIPPVKVLPSANAKVTGTIFVNNVMYVGTADNCGGVPNGVYAVDLTPVASAPAPPPAAGAPPVLPTAPNLTPASTTVMKWESKGGGIAGVGPAMGTDGTVYVATTDGDYSTTALSDSVVALDGRTLAQKDYFTPGKTPFTGSPVVFQYKGKDVIAAANKDGRVYLLDSTSLGGADHKTPMAKSAGGLGEPSGLATFEDADGTRWIFAASSAAIAATTGNEPPGAIVAFRLADQNGVPAFQTAWASRDITSPVTPVFVNGVVFALASGEARSAGQRSGNAVLYALDAATGKELWNSGTTITSSIHNVGPAVDDGQVMVMTSDGTLYTFGFVVER